MAVNEPELDDVTSDLAATLEQVAVKAPQHSLLWKYYAGKAPRKWLSTKLRDMFDELAEEIGEDNWVEVAVNEPIQRLHVQSWTSEQASAAEGFQTLWDKAMYRDEDDLYRSVGVVNEAYVFVSRDTLTGPVSLDLVPAAEVAWPVGVKRDPRVVGRVWRDVESGYWRATLWYRTAVARFIGPRFTPGDPVPGANKFTPLDEPGAPAHGFERVPVVRFTGPKANSLAATVTPNQDRVNKLTANKMVAGEFAAFPQRYFLTRQRVSADTLEASPHHAIVLHPGGDDAGTAPTSVGSFPAAELSNYDDAISQELYKMFARASLPKHLLADSASGMSAKAIRADEAPLVNLVVAMQEEADPAYEDLAELAGYEAVRPVWRPAETPDDETVMTTVKAAVDAGMPLDVALKYLAGWTEEQLADLEKPETFGQTVDNLTKLGLAAQAGGLDPAVAKQVGMRSLGVESNEPPPAN